MTVRPPTVRSGMRRLSILPPLDRISTKIIGTLVLSFLIAFAAIAMTLFISWQLEGGVAAINDVGGQRMRSYQIGLLMARGASENQAIAATNAIQEEMQRFDKVLADLATGDPVRPLSPPRNADIQSRLDTVKKAWQGELRPLVGAYLAAASPEGRQEILRRYDARLGDFVRSINELALSMEERYAFNTVLLRTFQITLAVLAAFGTAVLIRFFVQLVIRPVESLGTGIRRMAGDDLSVRLPVERADEFGVLAQGFNQMAEHLQEVYATLEERVASKTHSLEERNQDLRLLYEITSFLNDPLPLEELCQGFIARLRYALGAEAGKVRLYAPGDETSPEEFVVGQSARHDPADSGFAASAFAITQSKQRLGMFKLYFRQPHPVSEQEANLLETLGQHLGVAVENRRLLSRERELAISEERNLLAQELHDSIAQGLAFLNIQVQLLQDSLRRAEVSEALGIADQLQEGVQESYDHVRELLVHFRTRANAVDLDANLVSTLEKFEGQTGIATRFEHTGSGPALSAEEQIQIMHIVQESLSNIRKHAHARTVKVGLLRSPEKLSLEVLDDGIGFDPQTGPADLSERHVGLAIMRERAHRVGGYCDILSTPGGGTRVRLVLPYRRQGPGDGGQKERPAVAENPLVRDSKNLLGHKA